MTEADLPFDLSKLDKLAEVTVRVGLNLQPGQDLIISAPIEALPLVRRVAIAAYKAGAGIIAPIFSDEALTLARFNHGQDESFDAAPAWLYQGMAQAYAEGTARLAISADNPMMLRGQDPDKVARAGKANSIAARPALEKITGFETNWCVASYPGRAWARQVFADGSDDAAQARLAEAIFVASRLENNDPIAEWDAHHARLRARREWLTEQDFDALHFRSPGTDLRVGLAEGHAWKGGAGQSKTGTVCSPNIPTEEVFTTPHAQWVEGTVRASKPLVHQGTLIEGITARFEGGRIVEATATEGEAVFRKLIDTDEGAARLGEVALVPHSSPISQSGLLFYNTLFDENAACHIAQGQCYSECFRPEIASNPEAIKAGGGNSSMIHVDWMIGGPQTDIDGIRKDGSIVPVFRNGEWAQAL